MSDSNGYADAHAIRAVQSILNGKEALESDMQVLTGDVRSCLEAMQDGLREDGIQGVYKVFNALVKDRDWLMRLACAPPADDPDETASDRYVRFLEDDEFENCPPREWLIPGILPKEGIALLFGPPACGKSFLSMAWALCLATGKPWLGREVLHGPVAYIAGEGGFGIGARLKAWKRFTDWQGKSGVRWFGKSLVLQDTGHFSELIMAFLEDFPEPPIMVVLDTLSRCCGGADENNNSEMARIIAAADTLQQRFHCTVLIVHHCGKDGDRGPRGASALVGNTETIIEVARTDSGCRVTCYKQKDAPKFPPFSLKLQLIRYGPDEGDCSAVLVRDNEDSQPTLRQSETVMLAALAKAGDALTHGEWKQTGIDAGLSERAATLAIKNLVTLGKVEKRDKRYRLVEAKKDPEEGSSPG